MPQVHEPPPTADPDPVRAALADPEALERLRNQALFYLRQFCRSVSWTQLKHDSDDVVSEAIKLALERTADFDPERRTSVLIWIGGFVYNLSRHRGTRRSKDRAIGGANDWVSKVLDQRDTPLADLLQEEERNQVRAAMMKLHPDDRQLLEWKCFDRLRDREISERTGTLETTIRVQLLRARRALKALLDPTRKEGQS